MKQAIFRGFGQLNGSRMINLTIEVEDKTALDLHGPSRDSVKQAILSIHYPGVKINPKDVSVEIKELKESKLKTNVNKSITAKKPFSISSLVFSLIFFPFKIIWRIIKSIWNNNDHVGGTFLF